MCTVSSVSFGKSSFASKPIEVCRWTDVKVKQAWLYSLSAIATVGAVAMSRVALVGAAIPLAAVAVATAIYSRFLIDYEDPKILAFLRNEAIHMVLPRVVEKHGWMKLFRYSLLDPIQLQAAYRTYANTIPFTQIIDLYRNACSGRNEARADVNRYAIPAPIEWKGKFKQETRLLSCLKIIDSYDVRDLQEYGIITLSQRKVIDTVAKKRLEFSQSEAALEQQFCEATLMQHAALSQAKALAEKNYRLHSDHALLCQINSKERNGWANMSSMIILSEAQDLMNRSNAAADEQFRVSTLPERCHIDGLHAQNRKAFEDCISQCDKEFHRAG